MDLGEWKIPSIASGLRKTLFKVETSERCENDAGGLFQLPAEPLLVIGFKERVLYTAPTAIKDFGVCFERQHHGHSNTQPNFRQ
jgi:hypothetical protein